MLDTMVLGIAAGTLCTLSFVPQVVKIYMTKDTKDLSLLTFSAFAGGVFLWLMYGVVLNDIPIIVANGATFLLIIVIIIFKLKYR